MTAMKHVYPWIFAIGALLLMIHLFQKLVTGVGSADAEDAIALLVLAGVGRLVFPPEA